MEALYVPNALPPDLSDENQFAWVYKENFDAESLDNDMNYLYYKKMKTRYIFEVTNWF